MAPRIIKSVYRVINSISLTGFPYNPIGKCNFIALKAWNASHLPQILSSQVVDKMFDSSFRVVASLFRRFFVSPRYFVPSSRLPIRPVVSSPRWLRSLVSICHSSSRFASLMFRFVVSLRLFDRASLWTRKGTIRPRITWGSWLTGKYRELVKGWRNWKPTSTRGYSVFSTAYTNSSMRVRVK